MKRDILGVVAMPQTADDLKRRIETAYRASGNKLGWRFLYSPVAVLERADVAFIGLNPGGAEPEPDRLAMDSGSAYCDEVWWDDYAAGCSPLQEQVRALFAQLGVAPDAVLAGNFVPFRSADWQSLNSPDASLALGRELWREVLAQAGTRVVVTMGTVTRNELAALLGIEELNYHDTGWGRVRAARGSANGVTLVSLPHLSRYRLFGRPESAACLAELFRDLPIS